MSNSSVVSITALQMSVLNVAFYSFFTFIENNPVVSVSEGMFV